MVNRCVLSHLSRVQLCDPVDCSPPGSSVHGILQARTLEWVALSCPPPGDLPNPGIKPRPPALQVDCLPAGPQRKPKNPGVGSLSLLQWIFLTYANIKIKNYLNFTFLHVIFFGLVVQTMTDMDSYSCHHKLSTEGFHNLKEILLCSLFFVTPSPPILTLAIMILFLFFWFI